MDIKTSENKIGEIINLAQVLTSIMWDNINNGASFESVQPIYTDICQLSVMSNIEIDKAKKEFDVQMTKELERLTTKYLKDENGSKSLPEFMLEVSKQKPIIKDINIVLLKIRLTVVMILLWTILKNQCVSV